MTSIKKCLYRLSFCIIQSVHGLHELVALIVSIMNTFVVVIVTIILICDKRNPEYGCIFFLHILYIKEDSCSSNIIFLLKRVNIV